MKNDKCKKLPQYRTVKLPISDITWNSFIKLTKQRKQFKGGAIVSLIENELKKSDSNNNQIP